MTRRTHRRMAVCLVLLFADLVFIWGNSLLPGTVSSTLSDGLKAFLSHPFPFLQNSGSSSGSGFLRKAAHFCEFAMLGAILCWLFSMTFHRFLPVSGAAFFCGVATAFLDEGIQWFVPGRRTSIVDVGIDSAGVVFGMILSIAGYFIFSRRKR